MSKNKQSITIFGKLIYNVLLTWLFFYLIDGLREMMRGLYGTSTLDLYYLSTLVLPIMVVGLHMTTLSYSSFGFIMLSHLRWQQKFYKQEPSNLLVCICLILPGLFVDFLLQ